MKALVLHGVGEIPTYQNVDDPIAGDGQVVVDIKAAAMNHRDVWITKGQYPGLRFPIILGSDGAGVCNGQEVILQPGMEWGKDERFQSSKYHILGLPMDGTFAEKVVVPASNIVAKPKHLTWEQAAALPLAGLTAYRAVVTKGQTRAGDKVLITGIGGGVALAAMQFAQALGAEVYVTSSAPWKIEKAMKMGAVGAANYREDHWDKALVAIAGGFDVIIDSAGGDGFSKLVKVANPGARIVQYGGTHGNVTVNPQLMFWKQVSYHGTTMGSPKEFLDMVAFVEKHQIVPVVDEVFALEVGGQAFAHMHDSGQFGKIVLRP